MDATNIQKSVAFYTLAMNNPKINPCTVALNIIIYLGINLTKTCIIKTITHCWNKF